MTLRELAELFVRLGASDALNLDGGGSTTMVIGGELQNVPSDGLERRCPARWCCPAGRRPPVAQATEPRRPAARSDARRRPEPLTRPEQRGGAGRPAGRPGSSGGLLDP
jgi:hypothetical protein